MRNTVMTLALSCLVGIGTAWAEEDTERGRILAETCVGCHGVEGYTNAYPTYKVPRIAGQHEAYLVDSLQNYRETNRQHPTMVGQSQALSEEQIRDISAYLAGVGREDKRAYPRARSIGNPDRGGQIAEDAGCQACHGTDGNSPEGMQPPSPIIAGQYADYLYQSLKQYQDGSRDSATMAPLVENLDDRELRDLAAFYASQPGPLKIMPR